MTTWDCKADKVVKGDGLREIQPEQDKVYCDEDGFTHYIFKRTMFKNPKYKIPKGNSTLFEKFLDGGSREYPSDGNIPLDIVATEARIIINKIIDISMNPKELYYKDAVEVISCGRNSLVRGCVKLYLQKFTTRDWRRKRFTDDIDFWIFKIELFEYVLKRSGWVKNSKTKEWEKIVEWLNYDTNERESGALIASNDLALRMDFGGCSFLDSSSIKSIMSKKLKRGHDVDLSDIINTVLILNDEFGDRYNEMLEIWAAIEEAANTRSTRTISNMISLSRYSYAIADYIKRVGNSIAKHEKWIFDKSKYSQQDLRRICRYSPQWMGYLINNGAEATRSMIYSYLIEQQTVKRLHSRNLTIFADKLIEILNSKFRHLKIIFEIEPRIEYFSILNVVSSILQGTNT